MQPFGAALRQLLFEAGADVRVGAGEVQLVEDRADVQAGAADQDRHAAGGQEPLDCRAGVALVGGDGRGLGDVEDVEQVVRHAPAFVGVTLAVPMSMPR